MKWFTTAITVIKQFLKIYLFLSMSFVLSYATLFLFSIFSFQLEEFLLAFLIIRSSSDELCQLLAILGKYLFISSSCLMDRLAGYSILGWLLFSLSSVNKYIISLPSDLQGFCLKSVYCLMGRESLGYDKSLFSFQNFLFVFWQFDYHVCWCIYFLDLFHYWCLLNFLDLNVHFLFQSWEIYSHYFSE